MSSQGFDPSQHARAGDGRFEQMVTAEGPPLIDVVYSEDEGSFRYPPMPSTAAGLTHFWCKVDVPEDLLGRFRRAYNEKVDQDKQSELRRWDMSNPPPGGNADDPRHLAARDTAWARIQDRYRAKFMPLSYVRPLARVERMARYSRYLQPGQQAEFNQQRWTMPGGASKTAAEWVEEYDLKQVGRALDADADVDAVVQNASLRAMEENLRKMRFLQQFGHLPEDVPTT